MGYPTYEQTSIKKLLAEVKIELDIYNSTTEDSRIKRWIIEASKEMMTALEYVEKTATLEISNYQAILPCDFVKFDRPSPILFTTNGTVDTSCYYWNFSPVYTGAPFIECSPVNSGFDCWWGIPTVNVQKGRLYFSNNIDATECTISYLAVNMDGDDMVIPSINARPIIMYACGMYHLGTGKGDRYMNMWTNGKLHRRGLSRLPDSLEQQSIAWIMNSLLN